MVIATGPGFGKKPRPFLVVQADDYAALATVVLLPITTALADPPSRLRVAVVPGDSNGLRQLSEVCADIPITARRERIHQHIGKLDREDMLRVEQAVALVLGFAG